MARPAWFIIARTEYLEGARTRWFLISTVLGPIFMLGVVLFPAWLQSRGAGKTLHVALVDQSTDQIGAQVKASLEQAPPGRSARFAVDVPTGVDAESGALQERVDAGSLDGYLVLPPDASTGGRIVYRGTDASPGADMENLDRALEQAVHEARARSLHLSDDQFAQLTAPVDFEPEQATGAGQNASGGAAFAVAYFVAFMLYMGILLYGINVMRAVIQEKVNRVVEVVVACTTPLHLMLGKVLGAGALGLTQMAIWVGAGVVVSSNSGAILAHLGVHGASSIVLPSLSPAILVVIGAYFFGGYFLYSSIFAAIGAANNSDREAQQAQMPVTMMMVVAFLCFPVITSAPRDAAAVGLTMVPFLSPVLMPMRYLLSPVPAWQLALSLALLAGSVALAVWLASRIYRVGILMFGKRPTLGEIARWIRAS
jgi:ABC-2 type transport system permease protein